MRQDHEGRKPSSISLEGNNNGVLSQQRDCSLHFEPIRLLPIKTNFKPSIDRRQRPAPKRSCDSDQDKGQRRRPSDEGEASRGHKRPHISKQTPETSPVKSHEKHSRQEVAHSPARAKADNLIKVEKQSLGRRTEEHRKQSPPPPPPPLPPPPQKVSQAFLESISSDALDYAKHSGFFDELRMQLLDEIQKLDQFKSINESFQQDVSEFCRRQGTKFGQPRAMLREQFSNQCEQGRLKSVRKLEAAIEGVIAKHQNDLVQRYCNKLLECPQVQALTKRAQGAGAHEAPVEHQLESVAVVVTSKSRDSLQAAKREPIEESNRAAELANIPTPSPSVSPVQTPPSPILNRPSSTSTNNQDKEQKRKQRHSSSGSPLDIKIKVNHSPTPQSRRDRSSSKSDEVEQNNNFRHLQRPARKKRKSGKSKRKKRLRQREWEARQRNSRNNDRNISPAAFETGRRHDARRPSSCDLRRPGEGRRGTHSPAIEIKRMLPVALSDCRSDAAASGRQQTLAAQSTGLVVK